MWKTRLVLVVVPPVGRTTPASVADHTHKRILQQNSLAPTLGTGLARTGTKEPCT